MILMAVFGASALVLAIIGVYALISFSVQQRTRAIGIRIAPGAGSGAVRKMVVLQGMVPACAGIVIGIAAAFGLVRFLSEFLYGIGAWDGAVFAGIPVLPGAVARSAVWIPGRRASRIDPVIALRCDLPPRWRTRSGECATPSPLTGSARPPTPAGSSALRGSRAARLQRTGPGS